MPTITRRALAASSLALAAAPACARPAAPALAWPDATELAARIRRRELSAAEAVEQAIGAAEALQPKLNFLVNSDFDRALAKARGATAASGPFAGVPFLIKDLEDYTGLPTRSGSRAELARPPAVRQSVYMDAFDRAGLIVIGKSATPEFGLSPTTEPVAFGPTRNPFDPYRSAGGSSGGAAAAVAAGVLPFAHGSDGGGSLRIPAACCGLFALKPSRGRMIGSRGDVHAWDLGAQHALTRSVRDSAALFAATEDAEPGARYAPVGLVDRPGRRRLRIGYILETGLGRQPDAETARAADAAAKLVQSLGHTVQPTHWPIDGEEFAGDFLTLWAASAKQVVDAAAGGRAPSPDLFEPFTLALYEAAAKTAPADLQAALRRLERAAFAYDTWLAAEQLDVVLTPVVSMIAPYLGELAGTAPYPTLSQRFVDYAGYTPLHNVAGAPAMSVPLYWTAQNLPVGSMFAGRAGNERTLFELAYELEAAQPWAARRPWIHV